MSLNITKKQKFYLIKTLILLPTLAIYFFIIFTICVTFFFQNQIKEFFVAQINKQLLVEMQVNDIDFSVVRKFPYASISFHQVDIKEHNARDEKSKKSLLKAEYIFLEFSVFDIIKGNYSIKQLEVKNGQARIINFKDGTDNYHFWKPFTDTASTKFSFNLKKLKLNNVGIRFSDFGNQQFYSILAKNLIIKGKFSEKKFELTIDGETIIQFIKSFELKFFVNKSANLKVVFFVDNETSNYTITKGKLSTNNLNFDISGNFIYSEAKKFININILANEIKLKDLISELPTVYKNKLIDYNIEGKINFSSNICGSFLGKDFPSFSTNFNIVDGNISPDKNSVALKNVMLCAKYVMYFKKNNFYDSLNVKEFSAKFGNGYLKGKLLLKDFSKPFIDAELYANINLNDVKDFLKNDSITQLSGNLLLDCSIKNKFNSSNLTGSDIINGSIFGKAKIQNLNFELKNHAYNYKNLKGNFQFNNSDIVIDDFSGAISGNDFKLKGYLKNILPYLFNKKAKLLVDANLNSKYIDVEKLLSNQSSGNDTIQELKFPSDINFKLNLNIEKLVFKKFVASNIYGIANYKDKQFTANNLKINAFGGSIQADIDMFENPNQEFLIQSNVNVEKANVKEVFVQFENFGQENLKSGNIAGDLTTKVVFAAVMNKTLSLDLSKLFASADLTIENGQLINYEPMQKLSKFIKIADVNDIKFETLTNRFEIKDKKMSFPSMAINSSAINITASGEHSFDNEINYHLKILLSEILARRAKAAKKENEEFGVVEDDGLGRTGIYLLISGTVDNPVFKYDAKGVKEKIVVGVIKEKQILKNVLKEEFNWLKKDTISKKENKAEIEKKKKDKKIEEDFKIEWE